jgi:hypothetical protein
MISRPHIPILSRLRRILFGFVLAAGLGGWTSAKAGLIINATAGDISTPSPNMIGGGNITTIFNQAVAYWEMAFPDPAQTWTLDLTYNWGVLGEDQVARLTPLTVGGSPNRILTGSITFNHVDSDQFSWFADPNPGMMTNNPAFTIGPTVTNQSVDASSGTVELNTGLTYQAAPESPAYGRSDLLTIAMHEIGHGMGLLFNPSPPNDPPDWEPIHPLIITEAVSSHYAGTEIFTWAGEHLFTPSLMESATLTGTRVFPSSNDILAMAEISQYFDPKLNPYNVPGIPVPEPSSSLLILTSLSGLVFLLGRQRPKRLS